MIVNLKSILDIFLNLLENEAISLRDQLIRIINNIEFDEKRVSDKLKNNTYFSTLRS